MIKQKSDRDERTEPTKVVFRSLVLKAPRYITAQGHFTPILFYLSYGGQGRSFVHKDLVIPDCIDNDAFDHCGYTVRSLWIHGSIIVYRRWIRHNI